MSFWPSADTTISSWKRRAELLRAVWPVSRATGSPTGRRPGSLKPREDEAKEANILEQEKNQTSCSAIM